MTTLESALWICPGERSIWQHRVIEGDSNIASSNPDMQFCRSHEALSRFLSFDRVEVFSRPGADWESEILRQEDNWQKTTLKVIVWVAAWMLIIPGIVLISIKFAYMEKVQRLVKESILVTEYDRLRQFEHEGNKTAATLKKMDIIAETLRLASGNDRVVIRDSSTANAREFSCASSFNFMQTFAPDFITAHWEKPEILIENRETISFFIDYFGEERSMRLFRMVGVDINYKFQHGLGLTRDEIADFLALTGFVHVRDMEETYKTLCRRSDQGKGYLHLTPQQVREKMSTFALSSSARSGASQSRFCDFKELAKDQYDILWDIMVPLKMSTMFVDRMPKYVSADQNRGVSLESIIRGVWIEQSHLRYSPDMSQRDHDYSLAKSLMGAFNEYNSPSIAGRVVRQREGYLFVRPMIAAAGCYCIPLQAMGATLRDRVLEETDEQGVRLRDTYLSRLVFLPTQAFSAIPARWQSIFGIIQPSIGAKGALAIWPRLRRLLQRPGFERVEGLGYSQGGTQLAKVATLAMPHGSFRSITKICSPADEEATAALFKRVCEERRASRRGEEDYELRVTTIWHDDDKTHLAGQCEFTMDALASTDSGAPLVKHDVYWYRACGIEEEEGHVPGEKPHAPASVMDVVRQAYHAVLKGPHARDMTMHPEGYQWRHVSSLMDRSAVLHLIDNRPLGWEDVRQKYFAGVLHPNTPRSRFAEDAEAWIREETRERTLQMFQFERLRRADSSGASSREPSDLSFSS